MDALHMATVDVKGLTLHRTYQAIRYI